MRLLLAVSALFSLVSCVGADSGKSDSADSVPLVADVEWNSNYGLRCAEPEHGEVCYYLRSDHDFEVQPGERFVGVGVTECVLGEEPAIMLQVSSANDDDYDGLANVRYDMYFDCAGVVPEVGATFDYEEYLVGDLGTVIRIYGTGTYDPD